MQARNGVRRVTAALPALCELALGGTAVGTGLNTEAGALSCHRSLLVVC